MALRELSSLNNESLNEFRPGDSPETFQIDDDLIQKIEGHFGKGLIPDQDTICLTLMGTDITLEVPVTVRAILGRAHESNVHDPDVDLGKYGAQVLGVSRQHAALYRMNHLILIADLGSHNGTFLNGDRLEPKRFHILHDGDVIQLANLSMQIHFQ
jgi:hypothetical protein